MFLPRRGAAGSSLEAPRLLCGLGGVFGEMVELICIEIAACVSPSGVPFLEVLEFSSSNRLYPRPSRVPFLEMLESSYRTNCHCHRPSRVPFLEMLELMLFLDIIRTSPSRVPFLEMLEYLIRRTGFL